MISGSQRVFPCSPHPDSTNLCSGPMCVVPCAVGNEVAVNNIDMLSAQGSVQARH